MVDGVGKIGFMTTVRQAGEGDIPALARLRQRWSEEWAGHAIDDEGFAARFAEWYAVESGRRVVFVAELDGELVGMVNLAVFERMPKPGDPGSRWGYLGNAFVLTGHRDKGVGARLVDALVAHARELGCVRVVLSPSDRSVPFYRRAGFGPATMLMAQLLETP